MKEADKMEEKKRNRMFPLFVDLTEKKVLVVGAGTIASRRIETLLAFCDRLVVVAPQAGEKVRRYGRDGRLTLLEKRFAPEDLDGCFLVLAATDDRALNEEIYRECHRRGIWANDCSDKRFCDFHFPGIVCSGELTVGINASGSNHRRAKEARVMIERSLLSESVFQESSDGEKQHTPG